MKYWKNGIHDELIEDSTPIEDADWQELLAYADERGFSIIDNNGWPIAVPIMTPQESLAANIREDRNNRIKEQEWRIRRYSDEVLLGLEQTEDIIPVLRYIQALRDITKQPGFPSEIQWPDIPGEDIQG